MSSAIDTKSVNSIRVLAADAIQKANSGHPGLPLGSAPMAYELWANHMNHNPKDPKWENRDRFILSGGHGSALLYSLLHFFGYGITIEDMKNFRQLGSKTPGHPEYGRKSTQRGLFVNGYGTEYPCDQNSFRYGNGSWYGNGRKASCRNFQQRKLPSC